MYSWNVYVSYNTEHFEECFSDPVQIFSLLFTVFYLSFKFKLQWSEIKLISTELGVILQKSCCMASIIATLLLLSSHFADSNYVVEV